MLYYLLLIIILVILSIIVRYFFIELREHINSERYFIFPEARANWLRAHEIMHSQLDKYGYITFDLVHKANPKHIFYPKTIQEIQTIILKHPKSKIRVSGGHHTFNDISISNDIIIRTTHLKKILNINKLKKQVRAESGITLEELNIYLEKNELALHILPAIPYQTLGGVLGTSTHGSRADKGSMSSMLIDITMVLANGEVKTFDRNDYEFPALMTSIGALGVIYAATIQCEKLFAVKHVVKHMSLKNFITNLFYLKRDNLFLQAYIYPYIDPNKNNAVTLYLRKKINLTPELYQRIKEQRDPMKMELQSVEDSPDKIEMSHRVLTRNLEASFYTEAEVAIPEQNLIPAITDIIQLYHNHERRYKYKTIYPFLIRFTGPDSSLLAMNAGRQTVYIDVFEPGQNATDPKPTRFFQEFEDILISKYQGRPHYGKRHNLTNKKMKRIYGFQRIDAFNKIRDRLDPQRMFSNDYVNRLLGP